MKSLIYTVAFSVLFLATAHAQKDPKARQILDAMSSKYKKMAAFKANFKYIMENTQEGIKETFEGTIFVKGDKYKLLMEGQEIRFDGTNVWTYSKDLEEVQVAPNDPEDQEISISNIFDIYKEGYKYLYLESIEGGKTDVIDLVPDDTSLDYFKIRMQIASNTKELKNFRVFYKTGTQYLYEVVTFSEDSTLKDSDFTYTEKQLQGLELIDFR